jgi:hypothetical protein
VADATTDDLQAPDPRPGYYYVSVVDGPRSARLRGPFVDDHAGALAAVHDARRALERLDPRAAFWAFGTCRSEVDAGPGFLDDEDARHAAEFEASNSEETRP